MSIAAEKYVRLTTYKKDGTPKGLPVWIVDVGNDKVGFTTESTSWKVKRLSNNPQLTLQPSNAKGDVKPGTTAVSGAGELVRGPEADRILELVKKKYGFGYYMVQAMYKVRGIFGHKVVNDGAIVITLD